MDYSAFGKSDDDEAQRQLRLWKRLALLSTTVAALTGAACVMMVLTSSSSPPMPAALVRMPTSSEPQQALQQCTAMPTLHKMVLDSVTPIKLQRARGTCWMFAAVAMLEFSYRQQGISRGWLRPSQYLKMSEQAFGVAVLDACWSDPDMCLYDGDEIHTGKSTQGGEYTLLYHLRTLSNSSALPWSVCPYMQEPGHDHACAGLHAAQASSPLRFHVRSMATHYERLAMKTALRRGRLLALSMPLANVLHLLPCTAATRDTLGCDPSEAGGRCHACPSQRAYAGADCCIIAEREMSTMAGEFYYLPILPLRKEGGHAVNVVGFNDMFLTEAGFQGGWIIKNSWWDGLPPGPGWTHARGSHTLGYWLQRHSDADERSVCPNSHSPRSWYQCDDLYSCRSRLTARYAASIHKVLHLECTDASPFATGACKKGARYFLKRIAPWGDEPGDLGGGLSTACLLEDDPDVVATKADPSGGVTRRRRAEQRQQQEDGENNQKQKEEEDDEAPGDADEESSATKPTMEDKEDHAMAEATAKAAAAEICTPPLPLDDLALIFSPVPQEIKPNDPDQCGYYFMPYDILETLSVRFGGMFATELDIEWEPGSYANNAPRTDATATPAQAAAGASVDWTLVERDTLEQARTKFGGGPFPDIQTPTPS